MPRILVIDDDRFWRHHFVSQLSRDFDVTAVADQRSARHLLDSTSFDVVVMDSCVPGDSPNTYDLAKEVKGQTASTLIVTSDYLPYASAVGQGLADIIIHKNQLVARVRNLVVPLRESG